MARTKQRSASNILAELAAIQTLDDTQTEVIMELLDQLREAGVENEVDLPRIVTGGDTSSGKSSVLERITGIPFPSGEGVVTRFATEVVMRPAAETMVRITIVPDEARPGDQATKLGRFERTIYEMSEFGKVYEEATVVMCSQQSKAALLGDRLRIEVRGPGRSPITVIDLPGLIHATSASTSAGDRKLSHEIVKKYIKPSRTIILAIVSAANDVRNQEITQYAREVDPKGNRTMGIITKPDTLKKKSGSENEWMKLAKNEEITFELGWHVLVNKVEKLDSASPQEINKHEAKYFAAERFANLKTDILGLDKLMPRLCEVANQHVLAALPELQMEFDAKLDEAKGKLADLGYLRADDRARRTLLAQISRSFEFKAAAAVQGTYEAEAYLLPDNDSGRKLRAEVRMLNHDFARAMRLYGATLRIDGAANPAEVSKAPKNGRTYNYTEWVSEGKDMSRTKALDWVGSKLERCQGSELPGSVNPALVKVLFWELAMNWEALATKHIIKIDQACARFVKDLLTEVVGKGGSDVVKNIKIYRIDDMIKRTKQKAIDGLAQLIEDKTVAPMTYNDKAIREARAKQRQLVENARSPHGIQSACVTQSTTADMQPEADALELAMAFYTVALDVFIDNVCDQVVDRVMVLQVPKLLSCEWAAGLTDQELKDLAQESPKVAKKRVELETTANRMQDALDRFKRELGGLF